jgi:excisionase family DNA binding protein
MHLITAKEASQILGIRLARLYELTRLRLIPSVRMGEKAIRFDEAALREWIQRGGVNQGNSVGIERNGVER